MKEKLIEEFLKEQGINLNHTALIIYKEDYLRQPELKYLLTEFYSFIIDSQINDKNKLQDNCN
jgi:hypothetical protein